MKKTKSRKKLHIPVEEVERLAFLDLESLEKESIEKERLECNLTPLNIEIIRLVYVENLPIDEVAAIVGKDRSVVSRVKNSPNAIRYLRDWVAKNGVEEVKEKVKMLSYKAVNVLENILNNDDPDLIELRARVAKDVLDRAGVKETKEQKVTFTTIFDTIRNSIEESANKFGEKEISGTA